MNNKLIAEKASKQSQMQNDLAWAMTLHLCLLAMKNMLIYSGDFLYSINDTLNSVMLLFLILMYGWIAFKYSVWKRLPVFLCAVTVGLLLFVMITYLFDAERFSAQYYYVNRNMRNFLVYCFPLFVSASMLENYDLLMKKLYKMSQPMFIVATYTWICMITYFAGRLGGNSYSMTFGNAVLLLGMILIFQYYETKKPLCLIEFFACVAYVISFGSRGPLLCFAIAFVFVLFSSSKSSGFKFLIGVIFLSGILMALVFYQQILLALSDIFDSIGISSRVLRVMAMGDIFNDSGRSELIGSVLDALSKQPWGLGAFGGEKVAGLTHNLFVDILANFGYLFGTVYILWLLVSVAIEISKAKNNALLMFSIIVFPRAMFNDSFWASKELWIIMAMLISTSLIRKNRGCRE